MDISSPPVIVIRFSKWKIAWFIAMILVAIAGVFSCIQGGGILKCIMAVICILAGTAFAFLTYRDLGQINNPRITISNKGLQINDEEAYLWEMISNEKLIRQGSFKPTYFLGFDTPVGSRRIHLDDLDTQPHKIMELINQYRVFNKF